MSTPAGNVVSVTHIGPYTGIPQAHAVRDAWREHEGREFGGWSRGIYGDWTEVERTLQTEILYLLA